MAEEAKPWEAAFRRVRGVYSPELKYPPKPTSTDLDALETRLGFKFPLSYRAFAEEFGLGGDINDSLPHVLPLAHPDWTETTGRSSCVLSETHFYRTYYRSDDLLGRLIVFAMDGGYHDWGFDSADLHNPELREYRIYDINRETRATIVANSFDGWLLAIGERYRFERDEEPEEPEFALIYKPNSLDSRPIDYVRHTGFEVRKQAPASADANLWLAFNNNNAHHLARSIRDEGRADAFPILADALQDAGCAHADLLEACRTGDPDIDGKWVLQVLLGST